MKLAQICACINVETVESNHSTLTRAGKLGSPAASIEKSTSWKRKKVDLLDEHKGDIGQGACYQRLKSKQTGQTRCTAPRRASTMDYKRAAWKIKKKSEATTQAWRCHR
jgi:uncharacterized membrane protein